MTGFSTLAILLWPLILLSNHIPVHGRSLGLVVQDPLQKVLTPQLVQEGNITAARPFYAIAHRVLTAEGVKDALSNGANALEIDMTPYKDGWWANHNGIFGVRLTDYTAKQMFETIAAERTAGKPVTFVWLDIKAADWCPINDPAWQHCSVIALQNLARQILEPVGVRVMYGIYKPGEKAIKFLRNNLNSNEAFNLDGTAAEVAQQFANGGPADKRKRVMSYGWHTIREGFGDCSEPQDAKKTCTQLRLGASSGEFGNVFGWTVQKNHAWQVNMVLDKTEIEGLIYGFDHTSYYDHPDVREALSHITLWLKKNPQRRYLAGASDYPW